MSTSSELWPDHGGVSRSLILVRHGETMFNRERRYQGHEDVPLSPTGLEQARRVAQRLSGEQLVHCVASDLSRCRQTADLIAEPHGLTVEYTPDLREANLGALQGRPWDEASAILGDDSGYLTRLDIRASPPHGESPIDVRRRVQRFHRRLRQDLSRRAAGDIVVVAHGGSLRALLAVMLQLPAPAGWCFRFDNCSITVIDLDRHGQPTLRLYNDTAHLAD